MQTGIVGSSKKQLLRGTEDPLVIAGTEPVRRLWLLCYACQLPGQEGPICEFHEVLLDAVELTSHHLPGTKCELAALIEKDKL